MQSAGSLEALRARLGELEANLKPAWLCAGFAREPLLVKGAFLPVGREVAAVAPYGAAVDMSLRPADQHPGARTTVVATSAHPAWLPTRTRNSDCQPGL